MACKKLSVLADACGKQETGKTSGEPFYLTPQALTLGNLSDPVYGETEYEELQVATTDTSAQLPVLLKNSTVRRRKMNIVYVLFGLIVALFVAIIVICVVLALKLPKEKASHGGWGMWSQWGPCSVTCDTGIKSRHRTCSNPRPSSGGDYCDGESAGYLLCNNGACATLSSPVNGGWTNWKPWTECSATCGTGLQHRQRRCSNPEPRNGGNQCLGESLEYQPCNKTSCTVTPTQPTTATNITTPTCPEDWLNFTSSCYFFSQNNSRVFADAQAMCEQEDGHLAYLENEEENNFVKQYIINNGLQGRFWIGLSDQDHEGVWKYYGTEKVATFFDWHSGEPSNGYSKEHCVELFGRLGYDWNDIRCNIVIYYVCEKEM